MIAENVTQAASVRFKFEARLCVGVIKPWSICGFVRAGGGHGDPLGTCKGLFFCFSKACRLVESKGFINLLYTFKLMMPPK